MNDVVSGPLICMEARGSRARRRGEYFLAPRKFNEMVESISTTLIDNDVGEYF